MPALRCKVCGRPCVLVTVIVEERELQQDDVGRACTDVELEAQCWTLSQDRHVECAADPHHDCGYEVTYEDEAYEEILREKEEETPCRYTTGP